MRQATPCVHRGFVALVFALLFAFVGCRSATKSEEAMREQERTQLAELSRIQEHFEAGDHRTAMAEYEAMGRTQTTPLISGLVAVGIARCEVELGQCQRALGLLQHAERQLQGTSAYPQALIGLAESHIVQGAQRQACERLELAFKYLGAGRDRRFVAGLLTLLFDATGAHDQADRYRLSTVDGRGMSPARWATWRGRISPPPPIVERPRVDPPRDVPKVLALKVHRRSEWRARSSRRNVTKMSKITMITIHHTGESVAPDLDTRADVREHLRNVQRYHQDHRHWADIAYHYLIDPDGEVWEGRPISLQGAHAGGNLNKGNIGIAMMGNFERSKPSWKQARTLAKLVKQLGEKYHVRPDQVLTHAQCRHLGGLSETDCPGRYVEALMPKVRSGLTFSGSSSAARLPVASSPTSRREAIARRTRSSHHHTTSAH